MNNVWRLSFRYCVILCLIFTFLFIFNNQKSDAAGADDFVTTWKTDNPGTSSSTAVTIPGSGSGYSYDLTWTEVGNPSNTGTTTGITTSSHTVDFPSAGTYEVRIEGDFPGLFFRNTGDKDKIITVEQWGTSPLSSLEGAFYGATNLTITAVDTPNLSLVTNMDNAFRGATSFNQSIDNWDVSNVTSMISTFNGTPYNQPLNSWDVSQVTDMSFMFFNNSDFDQPLDMWDTGRVINFSSMFRGASSFDQPIGNWVTASSTDMSDMFRNTSFNQAIGSWNVEQVSDMTDMFRNNVSMSVANYDNLLSGWAAQDLQSDVTFDADDLLYCDSATDRASIIATYNWTITDAGENATCGAVATDDFVTTWKTDNPGTSSSTAVTIPGSGSGYSYDLTWTEVGNPSNTGTTTGITTSSHTVDFPSAGTYEVRIRGNFPRIFFDNEGDREKILTVEQWGTQEWSNMNNAFYGAVNLTVEASDTPDLTNVLSMNNMFRGATSFNQSIDNWDVSNVTSMISTFNGTPYNQPLNSWDVSQVTDMSFMFLNATNFGQPLNDWDVGDVENFDAMFRGATAFNRPLDNWNTVSAAIMNEMFRDTSFNQAIGSWNVEQVSDMTDMFRNNVSMSVANYDNLLSGWAAQDVQDDVVFDGGAGEYCADSARAALVTAFGWTITDGGPSTGCSDVAPTYLGTLVDQTYFAGREFAYETAEHFSGDLPRTYSASGLPAGLSINPVTGEITGNTDLLGITVVDVVASNGGGDSPAGSFNLNVLAATSSQPLSLYVSLTTNTSVSLAWSESVSDGGSAITDYDIEYRLFPDGDWVIFDNGTSTTLSAIVTGLIDNTRYQFRVTADNSLGISSPSNTVTQVTGVYVPADNSYACLANPGPLESLVGTFEDGKLKPVSENDKKFDARGATFIAPNDLSWANVELRGDNSDNMCWAGGYFTNELDWHDLDISWQQSKLGADQLGTFRNTTPIESFGSSTVLTGIHAYNVHDGVRTTNSDNNWTIQHSWFEYVRDDCVENDHILSGTIYDSLFDGCYVGISTRTGADWSGAGQTMVIDKALFRLEPMPFPFKWDTRNDPKLYVDGYEEPFGHGNMFKITEGNVPEFRIRDSVFLIEYDADARWFPDAADVAECSNNTLIWLDEDPTTAPTYLLDDFPGCFTIITDQTAGRAFWENIVDDWHDRHPDVGANRKPDNPGIYSWPRYSSEVVVNDSETSSGSSGGTRVSLSNDDGETTVETAEDAKTREELIARIIELQSLLATLQAQVGTTQITNCVFTRNLQLNDQGEDVRCLQQYLNRAGFTLASSDAGSPGQETTFFGQLTYNALVRFQEANSAAILTPVGLTSGSGYFGPSTRTFIAEN